jgi:hypothetical protein
MRRLGPGREHKLRKPIFIAAAIVVMLQAPVFGQEKIQPERRPESDTSGAGAVLCTWSIYLAVQGRVRECGLQRTPTDDAIDQAIAEIDEFILANASTRPTRADLENHKRSGTEVALRFSKEKFCRGDRDTEMMVRMLRERSPDKIREDTKALLAIPREPVMNPCL